MSCNARHCMCMCVLVVHIPWICTAAGRCSTQTDGISHIGWHPKPQMASRTMEYAWRQSLSSHTKHPARTENRSLQTDIMRKKGPRNALRSDPRTPKKGNLVKTENAKCIARNLPSFHAVRNVSHFRITTNMPRGDAQAIFSEPYGKNCKTGHGGPPRFI